MMSSDFMIVKSWISGQGTLVVPIPKEIREKLKLEGGTYFKLQVKDSKIILEPLKG